LGNPFKTGTFAPKYLSVRHLFVFILIVQLTGGNIAGVELMKVPFLVHHFHAHRALFPKDSWGDFLRLHYARTKHRDADTTHRHLPFQSVHGLSTGAMVMPAVIESTLSLPGPHSAVMASKFDDNLLPGDYRPGVRRPPRV